MILWYVTPCTLVYRYQTIRRRVGECRVPNVHRCENITFHTDIEIICSVLGVTVFWDVTPCLFGSYDHIRGIFCLNLPVRGGGRISPSALPRKKRKLRSFLPHFYSSVKAVVIKV